LLGIRGWWGYGINYGIGRLLGFGKRGGGWGGWRRRRHGGRLGCFGGRGWSAVGRGDGGLLAFLAF